MGKITWIEGDALNLPFDDESFDLRDDRVRVEERERYSTGDGGVETSVCVEAPSSRFWISTTRRIPRRRRCKDLCWITSSSRSPISTASPRSTGTCVRASNGFPRGREQVDLARDAGFREAKFYELAPGGLMGCLVCTK